MQVVVKLLKKLVAHFIAGLMRSGYRHLAIAAMHILRMLFRLQMRLRVMRVVSVVQAVSMLSARSKAIYPARSMSLRAVQRNGTGSFASKDIVRHEYSVTLPAVDILVFQNVEVVGGSEMLCAQDNYLIYDELAIGNPERYGTKAFGIVPAQAFGLHLPAFYKGQVLIVHSTRKRAPLAKAIHLCKDHSPNYFHWLFECMPRAIVALDQPEFAGWPLLVDAGLPTQCLAALQLLSGTREIISIGRAEVCNVSELVFPGAFSFMHDYYGRDILAQDLVISPEAVSLLRERLLPMAPVRRGRRLYVARDQAHYRRMLNEQQIQAKLSAQGFEIVRPERLSFVEQLEMFSGAEAIIGPTGAGMANMVFAAPTCKVIVLAGETYGANYLIFGQLGQLLGQELIYVTGEACKPWVMHSDYSIDISRLGDVLDNFGLIDIVRWSCAE